jgi:hypothetical protein
MFVETSAACAPGESDANRHRTATITGAAMDEMRRRLAEEIVVSSDSLLLRAGTGRAFRGLLGRGLLPFSCVNPSHAATWCLTLYAAMTGCSPAAPCGITCTGNMTTSIHLPCGDAVTSVTLSGPCGENEGGFKDYAVYPGLRDVDIGSPAAGACVVVITFSSGRTYETTINFATLSDPKVSGCPQCADYIGPTNGPFDVEPAGCADAATDGPASD